MPKSTRDKLIEVCDSNILACIKIKSQCSHIKYLFIEAEQTYNKSYAEQVVLIDQAMQVAEMLRDFFERYKREQL